MNAWIARSEPMTEHNPFDTIQYGISSKDSILGSNHDPHHEESIQYMTSTSSTDPARDGLDDFLALTRLQIDDEISRLYGDVPHTDPNVGSMIYNDEIYADAASLGNPPFEHNDAQASSQTLEDKNDDNVVVSDANEQSTAHDGTFTKRRGVRRSVSKQSLLPLKRGLKPLKWQNDIPGDWLEHLYRIISQYWPNDLDECTANKWGAVISTWLSRKPHLVHGLLANVPAAWKRVLEWSSPEAMRKRSQDFSRRIPNKKARRPHLTKAVWLVGTIQSDLKKQILDRLAEHWEGASPSATNGRLLSYAKLYTRITSPEPLLSADEKVFRYAADLIAMGPADNRGIKRHVDAGSHDILHQVSEQYNIEEGASNLDDPDKTSFGVKQVRRTSKRYQGANSWMTGLSSTEIDGIHNLITSHYRRNLYHQKVTQYLLAVNEILENNRISLDLIRNNDDVEAWRVARIAAQEDCNMVSPHAYEPSSEFRKRWSIAMQSSN